MDNDEHFRGGEGGRKIVLASPSRLPSPAAPSVLPSDLWEQTNCKRESHREISILRKEFLCVATQLSLPTLL